MSGGPAFQYQIVKEHASLLLYIQAIMSTRRLVAFINVNRNPNIYELESRKFFQKKRDI